MPRKTDLYSGGDMGEEAQGAWVPAYGAMITNLMILFMVLWAYTQFRPQDISSKTPPLPEVMLSKEIRKELETVGTVVMTRQKITVTLPSAVLFDPGSAALRDAALGSLETVASALSKSTAPIVVEGHTDDIPIRQSAWRSNYELSAARAFSVIRFLTASKGLPPSRLAARGFGPYHPKVPNDSDENRAQNRRIEIHLWTS